MIIHHRDPKLILNMNAELIKLMHESSFINRLQQPGTKSLMNFNTQINNNLRYFIFSHKAQAS